MPRLFCYLCVWVSVFVTSIQALLGPTRLRINHHHQRSYCRTTPLASPTHISRQNVVLNETLAPSYSGASTLEDEEQEELFSVSTRKEYLRTATENLLNYPAGSYHQQDVDSLKRLLITWPKKRSLEAAINVERLLKRLIDEKHVNPNGVTVEESLYVSAIEAWGRADIPGGPQRAQAIHDALTEHSRQHDPTLEPSIASYNSLMLAWRENVTASEMVFQQIPDPDLVSYTSLLDAYARSMRRIPNKTAAVARCEQVFDSMKVQRDQYCYSVLQNIYAKSGLPDAVNKTIGVLKSLEGAAASGDVFAKPSVTIYNAVLRALSRNPSRENALVATKLLDRLEKTSANSGVFPDRLSYANTILTCARCSDREFAATESKAQLERFEVRAAAEADKRTHASCVAPPLVHLDAESFNHVLIALSKSHLPLAVGLTFQLIKRMQQYAKEVPEMRPTIRSWNESVINGAKRILGHLDKKYQDGDASLKPNSFTYSAYLCINQMSGFTLKAPEEAGRIIEEMEQKYERGEIDDPPDPYHYTIQISTWSRSNRKESPGKVLEILSRMMQRSNAGFANCQPTLQSYNAVLDCLAKHGEGGRAEELLIFLLSQQGNAQHRIPGPDVSCFNHVIRALTQSSARDAGKRAERILDRFIEYHEEQKNREGPNFTSFVRIMFYYVNLDSRDSPYSAEYLLNRAINRFDDGDKTLEITSRAFVAVIDAYAGKHHPDAGRNADRLLKVAKRLAAEGAKYMKVDSTVLNSVMHAWLCSKDDSAALRVDKYLQQMEEAALAEGHRCAILPTSHSYSIALFAWSHSKLSSKYERSIDVYRRMQYQAVNGNPSVSIEDGLNRGLRRYIEVCQKERKQAPN